MGKPNKRGGLPTGDRSIINKFFRRLLPVGPPFFVEFPEIPDSKSIRIRKGDKINGDTDNKVYDGR